MTTVVVPARPVGPLTGTDAIRVPRTDTPPAFVVRPPETESPSPNLTPAPTPEARKRWYGAEPPETIVGSSPGDEYLDMSTGNLYILE